VAEPIIVEERNNIVPLRRFNYSRLWLASAASLLVLITVTALYLLPDRGQNHVATVTSPVANKSQPLTNSSSAPDQVVSKATADASINSEPKTQIGKIRGRRATTRNHQEIARNKKVTQENVTDFIPLTYTSDANELESGLMVRVNIQRSTLIAMGLPMNVEGD